MKPLVVTAPSPPAQILKIHFDEPPLIIIKTSRKPNASEKPNNGRDVISNLLQTSVGCNKKTAVLSPRKDIALVTKTSDS